MTASTRAAAAAGTVCVDPSPRFALSPFLFMQFMEPLGTTDGSVAAAWDFGRGQWREDVVEVSRELAPPLMRWGGCFASFYHWREAVGPRERRRPLINLCWGGLDSNHIGPVEFVDFCRRVGSEPLMCVNFESDGKPEFAKTPRGEPRVGTADEAADWVRYHNDPGDTLRHDHGHPDPLPIRLWQIGNETSYGGSWDGETCGRKTVEFAKAMRAVDPDLELIGWGDSGWAPRVLEIAGEHLQYLAFHHHIAPDKDTPLRGNEYRRDPAATWEHLMRGRDSLDQRIREMRADIQGYDVPLAMTEGHFILPGRNRCEVLSSWAAGVAYARMANVQARHGDVLKIATLADFCGTRWQVNAVMIPVPVGRPFMMPVAHVMRLFSRHVGEQALEVSNTPDDLDVTASRTGDRVYLHVANTNRTQSVPATLTVDGQKLAGGRTFTLAEDPEFEILEHDEQHYVVDEQSLPADGRWTFPAASVTAVELDLAGPSEPTKR